jgi:phage terminase large subunit-like protein
MEEHPMVISEQTNGPQVVEFIETFLTLGGSFIGQPFIMLEWMKRAVDDIYLIDSNGKRVRRTYLIGVPRKNAKSTLCAALGIYHLIVDRSDSAPQIISAAGDKKQARMVFDEAKRMVLASPELSAVCQVFRDEIRCSLTNGVYKVVSADAGLAHGLNPSVVIVDEYHVHKTSDLFVALTSGSATRSQPLTLVITTAGHNKESPLGVLYEYGRRVQSGEVVDPSFGFTWYGPNEGEEFDYKDPAKWELFNPSWEIMNPEEFASTAAHTPESEFIRYRLNGWTSTANAWFPAGAFENRADLDKHLEDNDVIVIGFDGAWKGDSTALVATRLSDFHQEVLGVWEAPVDDPHWRTPVDDVKKCIRDAFKRFTVKEMAADPFRFEQTLLELQEEGFPVIEFPTNSLARMIPATQAYYDAVMDESLTHDGNLTLQRHIANTVLKADNRGARITKEHRASKRHIDLAVAAVISHHRASVWREAPVKQQSKMLVL